MNRELRTAPRYPILAPVSFSGKEVAGEGTVTDISSRGLMIESPWLVRPDKSLSLRVSLPDQEKPLGIQLAEVRWVQDGKFGLQLVMMSRHDWDRVRQFAVPPRLATP